MEMMNRIESDLAELSQVEQYPKTEGRQMTMVLAPLGKKKGTTPAARKVEEPEVASEQ